MGSEPRSVAVRRYGPPLESCVLVTMTDGDERWRLLTGCGLRLGAAASDADVRAAVTSLIDGLVDSDDAGDRDAAGARVDVVALSHSGRSLAAAFGAAGWDRLDVGEVWLPWSEGPGPEAELVRSSLSGSAERLADTLSGLAAREATTAAQAIVDSCRRDESALDTLWSGFARRPVVRILHPDDGVVLDPRGSATPLASTYSAGPANVEVLAMPSAGAGAGVSGGAWANPASSPTSLRLFDDRFVVSQRRFVNRNLRAPEHLRMNLRTLGKVGAISRLQPIALALDLQRRHHLEGFGAMVRLGDATLMLTGGHPVPAPPRRERHGDARGVDPGIEVLITGDAPAAVPDGYRRLAVVAGGPRSGTGIELRPSPAAHWSTTVGDRWTEVVRHG